MAPRLTVSELISSLNQTLDYTYPLVEIEGEIASYKINQGKYVFFDIKDETSTIGCFMMLYQLRTSIADGMRVIITATPKLTQWGKFSLTVKTVQPSGEGSIKKSFELLRKKLEMEGLFADERKRKLPYPPSHIAVISSKQAAGYGDFIKIINERWGGMRIDLASVAVQGTDAADRIIRAIEYFNCREILPEAIVIVRGGGSADDLSTFNDEKLVRSIASSRIPTVSGIGHEVDITLSDLAVDMRASTPSNAAQLIVPDKNETIRRVKIQLNNLFIHLTKQIESNKQQLNAMLGEIISTTEHKIEARQNYIENISRILAELDPQRVLDRGYAIIRGNIETGSRIEIETSKYIINAEVNSYEKK